MKKHWIIIVLIPIAAILLFLNLDNQYLWQDEAETAALAKNTIKYGYPKAFDGKNLINPTIRTGYGKNFAWRYHPPVQFYIAALSIKTLGAGTLRARLPFAFIGLINIILLYIVALRFTKNAVASNITVLLVTFSTSYLLLMRQCRYYAPMIFLVLFILLFYSLFTEKKSSFFLIPMSLGLITLVYTIHGIFIAVFTALILHYIVFCRERETFPKALIAAIIVIICASPWFIFSNSGAHMAHITLSRVFKNLEFQVRMINKYIFPLFFFGVIYALKIIKTRTWRINLSLDEKGSLKIIGSVILVSIAILSFAEERNFRYLVFFIPLLAIVEGMILLRLFNFNKFLCAGFLAISIFTGVFNMGRFDCYFPKYLYEITHDYDGPIEGIIDFLWFRSRFRKEGEATVKISYGDAAVMYYTPFKVDNSKVYDDDHMPEWIVYRRYWDGEDILNSKYYQKVRQNYRKHVLEYPDIPWENRPGDLGYHKFATEKDAPPVIIYERKDIRY